MVYAVVCPASTMDIYGTRTVWLLPIARILARGDEPPGRDPVPRRLRVFWNTVNNGRASVEARLVVAPSQTTATFAFQWVSHLPADHTYPEPGA